MDKIYGQPGRRSTPRTPGAPGRRGRWSRAGCRPLRPHRAVTRSRTGALNVALRYSLPRESAEVHRRSRSIQGRTESGPGRQGAPLKVAQPPRPTGHRGPQHPAPWHCSRRPIRGDKRDRQGASSVTPGAPARLYRPLRTSRSVLKDPSQGRPSNAKVRGTVRALPGYDIQHRVFWTVGASKCSSSAVRHPTAARWRCSQP